MVRRATPVLLLALLAVAAIIAPGVAGTVPAVPTFLLMATVGGSLYPRESTEYAHSRGGSSGCVHCGVRRSEMARALTASWSYGAWR